LSTFTSETAGPGNLHSASEDSDKIPRGYLNYRQFDKRIPRKVIYTWIRKKSGNSGLREKTGSSNGITTNIGTVQTKSPDLGKPGFPQAFFLRTPKYSLRIKASPLRL